MLPKMSVISYQLSVVSYQRSVVSCQLLTTYDLQLTTCSSALFQWWLPLVKATMIMLNWFPALFMVCSHRTNEL
ncbi:hypothetical protein [Scytonema millei]|uniref:Uncharacterized protein n=1 Tax=Scytonema millei VB511283 TaxID=1245923 RepID=A0A9X5E5J3_9CYAN|nr:hypothetical protein [Scytonema millei]NHC35617.1 hypothetical protein [Scytonema millei VB511283]